jgi:hypothetical protein
MKKYIIWFIIGVIILLSIPLLWKNKTSLDLHKFTEEYFKQCFSLFQLLIAFSFFTLLYQFVESKKTITRLMVLREKITNLLTLEIGLNERVLHIEKLYTLVNLYVNLFANSNVDDEDDLLFYMFANEISINLASARKFVTNNEIYNENMLKVKELFGKFEKAVNNVHDDHAS